MHRLLSLLLLLTACNAPDRDIAPPASAAKSAQPKSLSSVPIPYTDIGACPFEGCIYRQWSVDEAVTFHEEPSDSSPVAFTAQRGDSVRAITGMVITIQPGIVVFHRPMALDATPDSVRGVAGDTLYLLTYHGEGFSLGWFKGKRYDDVEGVPFLRDNCSQRPSPCAAEQVQKVAAVWWVRVEFKGRSGWTREAQKLGNKDAYG